MGVQVKNAAGTALAGAAVRVLDKTGGQVFSGTTDANGQVTDIPIVTTVYQPDGAANPGAITTDARDRSRFRFRWPATRSSNQQITLDHSQSLRRPVGFQRWKPCAGGGQRQLQPEPGHGAVGGGQGVLANDTDADGNTLTAAVVSGPSHGTLTLNANGSFTYTPAAGYHGADSFTYKANDGAADSNVATVSLTINAVNHAPVAVNDSYSLNQDTVLSVAAPGVLANDTDADGNTLTAAR